MLMLRQRGKKPVAAIIVFWIAWLVLDLQAGNIYEKIYYVLCLIAAIVGLGLFVWFIDGSRDEQYHTDEPMISCDKANAEQWRANSDKKQV